MTAQKKSKTTRAASALSNMLAGRQQRKVSAQISGRAAEQWADLVDKAASKGLSADDVVTLLLHLAYVALAKELDSLAKEPDSVAKAASSVR